MVMVRIEHTVPDFEKWKMAFDNDPADRKGSGVRRFQLLRLHDNPNFVMIDLQFDNQGQATAFLNVMQRMQCCRWNWRECPLRTRIRCLSNLPDAFPRRFLAVDACVILQAPAASP